MYNRWLVENPMDRGAWWPPVHGIAKSQTQLSDFTFTFHFHALEKEMATHSSVLAWRIPGTGEPDGQLSLGSHRVEYDWSDLAAAAAVQVQCMKQGPQSWCSGTTQRDRVGREVRESFRTGGDICIHVSNSCWCMEKNIKILWSNYPPIKINNFKNVKA